MESDFLATWELLCLFFIFGTLIGSFLNVLIYRTNTGLGVSGRSRCFSCNKTLRWWELIPVVSYLLLRGRCARCSSRVSLQYPAVELATGVLFAYAGQQYITGWPFSLASVLEFLFVVSIGSLLLVITVYDLRHKIIPDQYVYAFILLAGIRLCVLWRYPVPLWGEFTSFDILAGPLLFFPFWFLWKVSHGRWMGLGDGKLAWGIGWLLGLSQGITAVIGGFWLGAAFALLLMALAVVVPVVGLRSLSPRLTMKSEIPFAPFLIASTAIVFYTGWDVLAMMFFVY